MRYHPISCRADISQASALIVPDAVSPRRNEVTLILTKSFQEQLPGEDYLVVTESDEVIGVAGYRRSRGQDLHYELHYLAVKDARRLLGIGKSLVERITKVLQDISPREFLTVTITTDQIDFFHKLGFRSVAVSGETSRLMLVQYKNGRRVSIQAPSLLGGGQPDQRGADDAVRFVAGTRYPTT